MCVYKPASSARLTAFNNKPRNSAIVARFVCFYQCQNYGLFRPIFTFIPIKSVHVRVSVESNGRSRRAIIDKALFTV